eukprot:363790-Chlamydomonas_euryale.AAC.33
MASRTSPRRRASPRAAPPRSLPPGAATRARPGATGQTTVLSPTRNAAAQAPGRQRPARPALCSTGRTAGRAAV